MHRAPPSLVEFWLLLALALIVVGRLIRRAELLELQDARIEVGRVPGDNAQPARMDPDQDRIRHAGPAGPGDP